ncbi:three-helix bundle dimerization domain-containing protein [Corynebacterium cystitidis]|uniref:three-helix bundle dimerization domain-containing protein n=1 Tax=Corynebacterium cystitidis TaxID=35757 RepID=UPI00211E8CA9|nr:hypothetical protein [Corynebacterium cystitidis]
MTVINNIRKDLYSRFTYSIDTEVIDQVLDAALEEHSERAIVQDFVPVLAERDAYNELTLYAAPALHIEFANRSNRAMARAAAALARDLTGRRVTATVAPTHPENSTDEKVEWVMDERGLNAPVDEREHRTMRTPDLVIYLGADEAHDRAGRNASTIDVPDTDGMTVEQVRDVIDALTEKLSATLQKHDIAAESATLPA